MNAKKAARVLRNLMMETDFNLTAFSGDYKRREMEAQVEALGMAIDLLEAQKPTLPTAFDYACEMADAVAARTKKG
jgi:hypothetical protein